MIADSEQAPFSTYLLGAPLKGRLQTVAENLRFTANPTTIMTVASKIIEVGSGVARKVHPKSPVEVLS